MIQSKTHEQLPLISASDTVLLPHTTVPLDLQPHRYRALDASTRNGERLIGMATVQDPHVAMPHADLQRRLIGLGRVVDTEPLTGEGHVLYLKGLGRGLVTEVHQPSPPVQSVRAEQIDDRLNSPDEASDLVWSVRGGLLLLQDRDIDGAETLNYEVSNMSVPGAVADVVGAAIFPDPEAKRQLLEELDVLARLRHVDARLADLVVQAYHSNPPEARERN